MVWDANADGPALRVLKHLRQLASSRQDECVWTRSQRFDEPIGPVIDPRVDAYFRQITANQCEIVFLVRPANPVDSINGLLIANTTSEGVARISRVRDQVAVANPLDDLCDPTRLRVGRVNFDQFGHARIVGEQNGRA